MPFPPNPKYSNSDINRAGESLLSTKPESEEYKEALNKVNLWRVSHAYPINTFKSSLHKKTKDYKKPIIAQRLKRMSTIIDKLERYPTMSLARMQDIGGVRAIVNSIKEVRELQIIYLDETRFTHELIREDDYILNPKDDGYRGVHLVFRYNNVNTRYKDAFQYNGLLLELQLRTKLQHTWATAVETMGTFRGEALKSQKGSKGWLRFFAITSSAFALVEKTEQVSKYNKMDAIETYKEVARLEKKLSVLEHIRGLSVAANAIHTKGYGGFYNLIILNSGDHSVQIASYTRNQLEEASRAYVAAEAQAVLGAKIEPVLVSAGPLKELKKAYPNYFLDVEDFVRKVEIIVSEVNNV
jgi:putative GTP pyrophosphokinase